MTESTKFHILPLDLAPFSGKRCTATHRNGHVSTGTIVVNNYNGQEETNRNYPWRFRPDATDEVCESYTSQGTIMRNSPNPGDILSIEEISETELDQHPELEERVVQLESKLETLLRHFHELSSEL